MSVRKDPAHTAAPVVTRIANQLDSLGYFHPDWDTSRTDTVVIVPGKRSVVDTIAVTGASPLCIDSVAVVRFPFSYDAALITRLARQTLASMAQRGYPFAKLHVVARHRGSDSAVISIDFVVQPDMRCAFDKAIFSGNFKTRPRVLERDIAFVRGQPYDDRKVAESIERLLSRSYIEDAQAGTPGFLPRAYLDSLKPNVPTGLASGDSSNPTEYVAVPIRVKDNSGMGLDGALALHSDKQLSNSMLSGNLTLTLLNVFRSGEEASIFYRGERDLQQFNMKVGRPHILQIPLTVRAAFGLEIREKSYGHLQGEVETLLEFGALWQTGIMLRGHETTIDGNGNGRSTWRFGGADVVLQRLPERYRAGVFSRQFSIRTGTGVSQRDEGRFQRWSIDCSAGMHVPTVRNQAFAGRIVAQSIIADERDSLHETEVFRTGGYASVRGYADNEFSFSTVGYVQSEYRYYFSTIGSVYIFLDGGVGFTDKMNLSHPYRTDMLGYGAGIRVPVKIGTVSLAWARNFKETRGFGRIHVRIQNVIARRTGW